MSISTTLNIHKNTLDRLDTISRQTGRTRAWIVSHLIQKQMSRCDNYEFRFTRIEYQRKSAKGWHRLHVQLRESEYEACLDMRRFYKKSVSLLFSLAIDMYYNELLIQSNNDNYYTLNYIITQEIIDMTICWRIYWGLPYDPGVLFTSSKDHHR